MKRSEQTWWTREAEVVDRPRPVIPSMREVARLALRKTAETKTAIRLPRRRALMVGYLYMEAEKAGCKMTLRRNGKYTYLWWTKKGPR